MAYVTTENAGENAGAKGTVLVEDFAREKMSWGGDVDREKRT